MRNLPTRRINICVRAGAFTALLLLAACAAFNKNESPAEAFGTKKFAEALVSSIPAKWFGSPERFALVDREGEALPHLFFDVNPGMDKEGKNVNFIVTTPQNYPTEQTLDLSSGQLYLSRKYCAQSDVWGEYKKLIDLPPYTSGVVPRILDQLNRPQKIIVFGQADYFRNYFTSNFFDARVVGGYVEQVCLEGGCVEPGAWLSRLVLIGVQKDNKKFEGVQNLEDLKKIVDWPLVRAFVGNGGGRNNIAGGFYPAYRMGAQVDRSQAMAFLRKNSHFFGAQELSKMRTGCYKLYDYLWADFSQDSKESFEKKFKRNLEKYRDRFNTCAKYVYPSSINADPKRHWFFAYLSGFYQLSEMGYYFDCSRKTWSANPVTHEGKRLYSLRGQLRHCSKNSMDEAMAQLPRYLEVLKLNHRASLRYIDYDSSSLGTHQKLYSWVEQDNKFLECSKTKEGTFFKDEQETFPKDVKWERPVPAPKTSAKKEKHVH